jgi:hypothetical protein
MDRTNAPLLWKGLLSLVFVFVLFVFVFVLSAERSAQRKKSYFSTPRHIGLLLL